MKQIYVSTEFFWQRPASVLAYVRALPSWMGVLSGAIGAFAPALSSMVGRILLETSPPGNLAATLSQFPSITLFFVAFTLVQGGIGILFGGKQNLGLFVAKMGWAWLPGAPIATFLVFMMWATASFRGQTGFSAAFAVALIMVFVILLSVVWTARLQMAVLQETLELKRRRALLVYWLTIIPGFIIYDLIV